MANCQAANNTLDPFQILLDKTDRGIATLEKEYANIITYVDSFRNTGQAFDPAQISNKADVLDALNEFTDEAICASKTNLAPIDRFTEDCLNDIMQQVKKYVNRILENVEDGIDLINDILALPESTLIKLFQQIWKLCNNIRNLVEGLDRKLQCVVINDELGIYTAQAVALQDRVDAVIDGLYLSEDGSFDPDRLMTGFATALKENIDLYKARADDLIEDIQGNVSDAISATTNVNPRPNW
jgi:hypothetical protein